MFRLGVWKALDSGSDFAPCFQGLAMKRDPFQCQMRDFVPPLGQQRESLGR